MLLLSNAQQAPSLLRLPRMGVADARAPTRSAAGPRPHAYRLLAELHDAAQLLVLEVLLVKIETQSASSVSSTQTIQVQAAV